MEEILHQLRYIEPCNLWDSWHINWVQDFLHQQHYGILNVYIYIINNNTI